MVEFHPYLTLTTTNYSSNFILFSYIIDQQPS